MPIVTFVNQLLGILTIIAQVAIVALVVVLLMKRATPTSELLKWVGNHAVLLAFIVALAATLGSLFYSEIAGYTPCKLCWYQRIFMYPQVILLGLAFWKQDRQIARYSLTLSVIGAVIAAYHYWLQLGGNPLIPCSTVGYSVSCAQRFVLQFGYITIPLEALTAFVLMALLMLVVKKNFRSQKL